ncbi:MAG: hypothetical protein AAGF45_09580 [Pseudomonadota bacterium]
MNIFNFIDDAFDFVKDKGEDAVEDAPHIWHDVEYIFEYTGETTEDWIEAIENAGSDAWDSTVDGLKDFSSWLDDALDWF